MERIGIFGGTFNPPHIGHIQAAQQAVQALGLTKLLMIPNGIAPHKPIPEGTPSPEQRLEMLRIGVKDCPGIQASDLEIRRAGPSYTVDTVRDIRAQYPQAELILVVGSDMLTSFHQWREPEAILSQVTLAALCRGEKGEQARMEQAARALESSGGKVTWVRNDAVAISSTQLRRLLAFQCADAFLPQGVGDYIRQQGLYHTRADWKNLPMEQLEEVVISLLNANRVAHVLGCRDTAVELAKRWGADENDAARAGILHDITKALDGPLQLTLCAAYGKILNDFSRKYPKTLHALTGSLVAQRIFGENEAVVRAICHHTTGRADMTLLEKIIYVADYMEPNRDFDGVTKLRELAFSDLDGALKLGLEMTLEHLKRQGNEVSPESREALAFLREKQSL